MAKNPNRNPEKGFLDEISSDLHKAEKVKASKPFTWGKPVSGGESRPNQMNVPRRLNEQSKIGRPKTNLVSETKAKKNIKA